MRGESMLEPKKDEFVEIKVGFNQQQRQLIEKIKRKQTWVKRMPR